MLLGFLWLHGVILPSANLLPHQYFSSWQFLYRIVPALNRSELRPERVYCTYISKPEKVILLYEQPDVEKDRMFFFNVLGDGECSRTVLWKIIFLRPIIIDRNWEKKTLFLILDCKIWNYIFNTSKTVLQTDTFVEMQTGACYRGHGISLQLPNNCACQSSQYSSVCFARARGRY